MTPDERIFISVQDASDRINIGRTRFFALLSEGAIKSCLVGKRRLVSVASLNEWANALLVAANNK